MSINRRQFIQATGVALCAASLPVEAKDKKKQLTPLPIPPLLQSKGGQPLFVTFKQGKWAFGGETKSKIWEINGQYIGPTVRVKNGDDIKLVYSNGLDSDVAMTVSGLQVAGSIIGGASRMIKAGRDWSPVLPIRQREATCWYHAATPRKTAEHLYKGLVGMWIVEDENSSSSVLPKNYGFDDFPLILQDKYINKLGEVNYDADSKGFLGDTLIVNGVQNPFISVSRGWVRLRLVNASNSRRYALRCHNDAPMLLVANDLGLLQTPVELTKLNLAPGERREVLINMANYDEVKLITNEHADLLTRIRGLFQRSSVLKSNLVLTIKASGLMSAVTAAMPKHLHGASTAVGATGRAREIRLGDYAAPGINGAPWSAERIDVNTELDAWERWRVSAETPQAFHIQGAPFIVRSVNGNAPNDEDQGWKDTVWVDGEVELWVNFSNVATKNFPLRFYSQNAEFADQGTMGQIQVKVPR